MDYSLLLVTEKTRLVDGSSDLNSSEEKTGDHLPSILTNFGFDNMQPGLRRATNNKANKHFSVIGKGAFGTSEL